MRRVVQTMAFLLWGFCVHATHIVGGEFEILHIEGDRYLFRQIQYFDVINGNPLAKDIQIDASIFRKRDNVFVRSVLMRYQTESLVPYTNPECTDSRLVTNRIVYATEVTLNPALFSDPEGYYMVWERCCRNNIITNIVQPDQTGQTFYIEFPPIRKNGEEFRNSSPQLFPPLSDYACVNRFYYVDFRGNDPDGDSLVYSLATPFNSSAFDPLPTPTPAPHPFVNWVQGINSSYQIPGNPTLSINSKGFLTVTPSEEGLFVFSVRCEEFRDGIKLGEVVRDFQLFVIDCPNPGNPPEIQVKAPGSNLFVSTLNTIVLKPEDDKCFTFQITDKDGSETISIRAEPVNFEASLDGILSTEIGYIDAPDDTLEVQVCLPDCPYLLGEPFIIDIIAGDFTCPLPLMDTMRISVIVEPPPNQPPRFVVPAQKQITLSVLEGTLIDIPFSAIDDDLDPLLLAVEGVDFNTQVFGIQIDTIINEDGRMDFRLRWNTDCSIYPFSIKDEFTIKLYIEDDDFCQIDNRDSIILNIKVQLPANNLPQVFINNSGSDIETSTAVGDQMQFMISATDRDLTDLLELRAIGVGFSLEDLGIVFSDAEGYGNVSSAFSWTVGCDAYEYLPQGRYEILFIAEDEDLCKIPNADTLKLTFNVNPPVNNPPVIQLINTQDDDSVGAIAGDNVDIELLAYDMDNDSISVFLLDDALHSDQGVEFSGGTGYGNIYSNLSWATDCSLLGDNYQPASYQFEVVVQDYKCIVPKADTLTLTIVVKDEEFDYNIQLPNVFTPNQEDNINITFYIPNLPGDNCRRQFKEVKIVNRYGKEVFTSNEPDFHWDGSGYPTGVYYMLISYSDMSMRGTISILK